MSNISIPNNWAPRWYQHNLFHRLQNGTKRAVCVWHRRAGKDVAMINFAAMGMMHRVGTYWHVFPTQKQARKAIWEGITSSGQKIVDQAFPKEIRSRKINDEMMIELKNGSIWRLVGGDNYDSLVGSNVAGVTFSEFAITNPASWDFVRPILVESGGWAAFISTPRGHNHLWRMYEMALTNPSWHAEVMTVFDTMAFGNRKNTQFILDEELAAGMRPERLEQEYLCSWTAANVGSVFGEEMNLARKQGRVDHVPHDPNLPVETCWDLGVVDQTAIWFLQRKNGTLRAIDYHAEPAKGKGLPYFLDLCSKKPYGYSRHIGPHDLERENIGTATTPWEVAFAHGFHFTSAPKLNLETGLDMTRRMLATMVFDKTNCALGIAALDQYQYKWDEETDTFSNTPIHDWSSDGCDALRMYAQTPEYQGMIPDWARREVTGPKIPKSNIAASRMGVPFGHNGGPPLDDDFDPLEAYR